MNDSQWWRDSVTYQIYIRSFADGNGDGVGDIAGIRSRLPYLADLGVDAIWINPWYPSPMADGGYDVADYRAVEPIFGTLDEAKAMIAEAHGAGIRVMLDVVPNHSSDQHVWFAEALAAAPGSPERDRYIFRDGTGPGGAEPPNNWVSFFGGPAWSRVEDGLWYLHLFAPEQPDLNWENPEVAAEFEEMFRFWFDLDVDGFRIDVAHSLFKAPGLPDLDRPAEGPDPSSHDDHPYLDLPPPPPAVPDLASARRHLRPAARVRGRGVGAGSRATREVRASRRAAHHLQLPVPRFSVDGS